MAVFFKHAPNKGEYALEQENRLPWVLVRGAGDLATGVIVRLHRCGFKVIATESANPSAIRRRAAL